MHMLINAVVLAATLPADPAEIARDIPECHAAIEGGMLNTRVEFAGGYAIEGPWRVMHNGRAELHDGREGRAISAVLERMVEIDAITGSHRMTEFPQGIAIRFVGHTQDELIEKAAQLWCLAVMRMRGGATGRFAPATIPPQRVAAGPGRAPPAV
jgi:hypothetical protein